MPTKESGLIRGTAASNEASGQQLFISAAVMTQPSRDWSTEWEAGWLPTPPLPLSQLQPCLLALVPPAGTPGPSFYLSMSKSLLQVKTPPPPQSPQGFI